MLFQSRSPAKPSRTLCNHRPAAGDWVNIGSRLRRFRWTLHADAWQQIATLCAEPVSRIEGLSIPVTARNRLGSLTKPARKPKKTALTCRSWVIAQANDHERHVSAASRARNARFRAARLILHKMLCKELWTAPARLGVSLDPMRSKTITKGEGCIAFAFPFVNRIPARSGRAAYREAEQ